MSKQHEMVGKIFPTNNGGDCIVVEYVNSKKVVVEFMDEHKFRVKTNTSAIYRGDVRNNFARSVSGVGFLGSGKYKRTVNGKATAAYQYWRGMFNRCYDEGYLKKRPTYRGCTVCDEWHNFQVFAKWLYKQEFIKSGYELDKDILLKGNRIYSPETCCLVPRQINTVLNNCAASRGSLPQGVDTCSVVGKYRARVRISGKNTELGVFDTIESAYKAYKKAKEDNVKNVALEWKDAIDKKVFKALMSWELS